MSEVLIEYEAVIADKDGRSYTARACGREVEDRWEGWLEFVPTKGGTVARSLRETTQPNRTDVEYWATGLTPIYLEGALWRALEPAPQPVFDRPVTTSTAYDAPATPPRSVGGVASAPPIRARPVLNPFSVAEQGEDVLRAELGALDGPRLRDILRGHSLVKGDTTVLMRLSEAELTDMIIAAVRDLTKPRSSDSAVRAEAPRARP